jgi:phage baseplate assembly protein W
MTLLLKRSREYVDVDFSFGNHPLSKNLLIKKEKNAVKQSIIHLMTLKEGDKPFHPEIKSPIYTYLFEPATSIVQVVLAGEVKNYLSIFEPRVLIKYVRISYPTPNDISCEIYGEIINISEPFNVNILINRIR